MRHAWDARQASSYSTRYFSLDALTGGADNRIDVPPSPPELTTGPSLENGKEQFRSMKHPDLLPSMKGRRFTAGDHNA